MSPFFEIRTSTSPFPARQAPEQHCCRFSSYRKRETALSPRFLIPLSAPGWIKFFMPCSCADMIPPRPSKSSFLMRTKSRRISPSLEQFPPNCHWLSPPSRIYHRPSGPPRFHLYGSLSFSLLRVKSRETPYYPCRFFPQCHSPEHCKDEGILSFFPTLN